MVRRGREPARAAAAHAFGGGQTGHFEVDAVGDCPYTVNMAVSALTTPPTGTVYVDEPWLLMRWDSAHRLVYMRWASEASLTL
jgi:hypothetical protein